MQAANAVVLTAARRQDDDGHGWPNEPQLAQDLQAVLTRQHQIEQDEVGVGAGRCRETTDPVSSFADFIARQAQGIDDATTDGGFIFHDDDTRRSHESAPDRQGKERSPLTKTTRLG